MYVYFDMNYNYHKAKVIIIYCKYLFNYLFIHLFSEKTVLFGAPLKQENVATIYQLIEFLGRPESK